VQGVRCRVHGSEFKVEFRAASSSHDEAVLRSNRFSSGPSLVSNPSICGANQSNLQRRFDPPPPPEIHPMHTRSWQPPPAMTRQCYFGVWGFELGSRIQAEESGLRVQGIESGFAQGAWCMVHGAGFRVQGSAQRCLLQPR
jgi:hypothetical protein